jgi:hypothetical protein
MRVTVMVGGQTRARVGTLVNSLQLSSSFDWDEIDCYASIERTYINSQFIEKVAYTLILSTAKSVTVFQFIWKKAQQAYIYMHVQNMITPVWQNVANGYLVENLTF